MKPAYGVSERFLRDFVEKVVAARSPKSETLLAALRGGSLSDEHRETIRELLAEELTETGFGPDDEPNETGRLAETAIDWLGHQ